MKPIEFIVAGFEGDQTAEKVLGELRSMDNADELKVLNLAVVRKNALGEVTASDDGDVKPGGGAIFGALVGAIIGFLGGPGGAVIGAAAGALTGGITAAGIDLGFSAEALETLKASLPPNRSAVLALVESDEMDRFVEEIHGRGGQIVHTALRDELITRMHKDENKDWEKF